VIRDCELDELEKNP